jgi:hypothetical protein
MAGKTQGAALVISAEERKGLEQLRDARKAPKREGERVAILVHYVEGAGGEQAHHLQTYRRGVGGWRGIWIEGPLPSRQRACDYGRR